MADSFLSTMQVWREQTIRDLRRRWWWALVGPLLILFGRLTEHRIYTLMNDYIDTHVMGKLTPQVLWVSLHALEIAIALFFMPLLAIAAHAYFVARPAGITAKFIRSHMYPSEWAIPHAMQILEELGNTGQKYTFDLLMEVFLVNTGPDIGVKNVRAEAELEGQSWERLERIRDLKNYQLKITKEGRDYRGQSVLNSRRVELEDLMEKIDGGLRSRITYRGWLRFRIEATKKQAEGKVQAKLWIIDALGNEHSVTTAAEHELEPSEGEITYAPRQQ
jgi:hypothetical protein